MQFEDATRKQLLHIALYENCSLDDKYQAVRELQLRRWQDEMLPDLLKLWGGGWSAFHIGIELGIPESTVRSRLIKHELFGKRIS